MKYTPITNIKVSICFNADNKLTVGRLAILNNTIYFEYDPKFIETKLEISPFKLPLTRETKTFDLYTEGLPGVFNDSLPDGWGRSLLDRKLTEAGIVPEQLSPLDRLAYTGDRGMGALTYEPDFAHNFDEIRLNLDTLAKQVNQFLSGNSTKVLEQLIQLNGSSAGARPKVMIALDKGRKNILFNLNKEGYEQWIVKFPNYNDGKDKGAIEYVYALMAKEAGLNVQECHLFEAKNSPGYFATKRFDRFNNNKIHVHSVAGLINATTDTFTDYEFLLKLTLSLTKDIIEVEQIFKLAVFNVLSYNRDDHLKNFSFLMHENGNWKLSPAYDLTFSSGPGGQHTTTVLGEGQNPTTSHLIELGKRAEITKKRIDTIIAQTKAALAKWNKYAKKCGVNKENIKLINSRIQS